MRTISEGGTGAAEIEGVAVGDITRGGDGAGVGWTAGAVGTAMTTGGSGVGSTATGLASLLEPVVLHPDSASRNDVASNPVL